MVVCVKSVVHPATGTETLALDLSITDTSTCQYVLESGAANNWRELGNMSIENAQLIGVSVGVVWAVAFGFKLIISALRVDEPNS
jgi:hypothetical protein